MNNSNDNMFDNVNNLNSGLATNPIEPGIGTETLNPVNINTPVEVMAPVIDIPIPTVDPIPEIVSTPTDAVNPVPTVQPVVNESMISPVDNPIPTEPTSNLGMADSININTTSSVLETPSQPIISTPEIISTPTEVVNPVPTVQPVVNESMISPVDNSIPTEPISNLGMADSININTTTSVLETPSQPIISTPEMISTPTDAVNPVPTVQPVVNESIISPVDNPISVEPIISSEIRNLENSNTQEEITTPVIDIPTPSVGPIPEMISTPTDAVNPVPTVQPVVNESIISPVDNLIPIEPTVLATIQENSPQNFVTPTDNDSNSNNITIIPEVDNFKNMNSHLQENGINQDDSSNFLNSPEIIPVDSAVLPFTLGSNNIETTNNNSIEQANPISPIQENSMENSDTMDGNPFKVASANPVVPPIPNPLGEVVAIGENGQPTALGKEVQLMDSPEDNELLKSFINNNYEKITTRPFNLSALFLSSLYLFYRKMFLFGILVFIVCSAISIFVSHYLTFVISIILGIAFNKVYISSAKKKIAKIKIQNPEKDFSELKAICSKKGGTSIGVACLGSFLILIVLIGLCFALLAMGMTTMLGPFATFFESIINAYNLAGNGAYNGAMVYDTSIKIEDNFTMYAPVRFENKSNGYEYSYSYSGEDGVSSTCSVSLSSQKGFMNGEDLINQMSKYYSKENSSLEVKTNNINGIEWKTFSHTDSTGTTYYYGATKDGKAYLLQYVIEENAPTDCGGYREQILNSINSK